MYAVSLCLFWTKRSPFACQNRQQINLTFFLIYLRNKKNWQPSFSLVIFTVCAKKMVNSATRKTKRGQCNRKKAKREKRNKRKTKKERNEKSARRGKKKEIGGVEVSEDKQGARSAKNDISKGQKSTPFFVLFRAADPSRLSSLSLQIMISTVRNGSRNLGRATSDVRNSSLNSAMI